MKCIGHPSMMKHKVQTLAVTKYYVHICTYCNEVLYVSSQLESEQCVSIYMTETLHSDFVIFENKEW